MSSPFRGLGQYYDSETRLSCTRYRYWEAETGRWLSADPLGIFGGANLLGFDGIPTVDVDPLGLTCPPSVKNTNGLSDKEVKKLNKTLARIHEEANAGKVRKGKGYHGDTRHGFSDERVAEVLGSPDAVYRSSGKSGRLTYYKDGDVVIVEGRGAGAGNAVTAYGSSGRLGDSGASALGGSANDPGKPVTQSAISDGTIPVAPGSPPIPAASQIWP